MSQAAGCLLVHTFSPRELEGRRKIDRCAANTVEKRDTNFIILPEHFWVTQAKVKWQFLWKFPGNIKVENYSPTTPTASPVLKIL